MSPGRHRRGLVADGQLHLAFEQHSRLLVGMMVGRDHAAFVQLQARKHDPLAMGRARAGSGGELDFGVIVGIDEGHGCAPSGRAAESARRYGADPTHAGVRTVLYRRLRVVGGERWLSETCLASAWRWPRPVGWIAAPSPAGWSKRACGLSHSRPTWDSLTRRTSTTSPSACDPPGAEDAVLVDARDELARAGVEIIQTQARYEGGYWNTTGIARHVTVQALLPEVQRRGITVLGHGATGRGNDQVRFQLVTNMLAPEVQVYAPVARHGFLGAIPGSPGNDRLLRTRRDTHPRDASTGPTQPTPICSD